MNNILTLVVLLAACSLVINREAFLQEKINKLAEISNFDVAQFLAGFINGVAVFSDLSIQKNECASRFTDPLLINEVLQIINLIKSLSSETDYTNIFKDIAEHAGNVLEKAQTAFLSCLVLGNDFKNVFDNLIAYLSAEDFSQRLSQHTLMNIETLMGKIVKTNADFHEGFANQIGNDCGDLVNFALLFDFKQEKHLLS